MSDYKDVMQAAENKRKTAAFLILKHGYTTPKILEYAFNVDAKSVQNSLYRWAKRDFIKRVNLPLSQQSLVMLTPEAARISAAELGLNIKYSSSPAKISTTLIQHTLAVQLIAIEHAKQLDELLFELENYWVEPRLKNNSKSHFTRGDLLINDTLLEAELTQKTSARLKNKLILIINFLREQREDLSKRRFETRAKEDIDLLKVEWHCSKDSIKNKLENAFFEVADLITTDISVFAMPDNERESFKRKVIQNMSFHTNELIKLT